MVSVRILVQENNFVSFSSQKTSTFLGVQITNSIEQFFRRNTTGGDRQHILGQFGDDWKVVMISLPPLQQLLLVVIIANLELLILLNLISITVFTGGGHSTIIKDLEKL
jgi:hypothetical protein